VNLALEVQQNYSITRPPGRVLGEMKPCVGPQQWISPAR